MISIKGGDDLHKVAVLNPKGGCGKTTLATNLAACYARCGPPPTLVDCDPEGFSMRWLEKRPAGRAPIRGVEAAGDTVDLTVPCGDGAPQASSTALFDLPAAIPNARLHGYTYAADSILIPIMPSAIDVYAATRFIAELLLDAQLDRHEQKVAIVANRIRCNTKSYQMLRRFLTSLRIPVIAALRDSQSFVYAAAHGIGLCEMPAHRVKSDIDQLNAVLAWLRKRRAMLQRARTVERREALIARAAYQRAERRGFEGGDAVADWLAAEQEIEAGERR